MIVACIPARLALPWNSFSSSVIKLLFLIDRATSVTLFPRRKLRVFEIFSSYDVSWRINRASVYARRFTALIARALAAGLARRWRVLFYVDESYDRARFCLSAIGIRHVDWRDCFQLMVVE
jgi:hypothetical protein